VRSRGYPRKRPRTPRRGSPRSPSCRASSELPKAVKRLSGLPRARATQIRWRLRCRSPARSEWEWAWSSSATPCGPGAQLRGTGRRRPPRHPKLVPECYQPPSGTRGAAEAATRCQAAPIGGLRGTSNQVPRPTPRQEPDSPKSAVAVRCFRPSWAISCAVSTHRSPTDTASKSAT